MSGLLRRWRSYWFDPTPLFDLAIARIAIVGYHLWYVLQPGYRGALRESTAFPDSLYDALPLLHVLVLPAGWDFRPGPDLVAAVYWIAVLAGFLAFFGILTRAALLTFAVGSGFLQSFLYSFGDYHHPEAVLVIALGVLALSPAGGMLSVDDLRRRFRRVEEDGRFRDFDIKREESTWAGWPLKLIGWVFVLVYFSAAYFKLRNAGLDWANGYTLGYAMMRDGIRWDVAIGRWLASHHALMVAMSWLSLVFEATFALAMLVPLTRWIFLPLGSGFHLGIYYTMRAPFQGYIAAYSALVPWRDGLERVARRFGRPANPPVVLYDEHCPLCLRSMTFLRYWDWLDRLSLRGIREGDESAGDLDPEALGRRMHAVFPDGSVERGFFAFRRLLRQLPPLWPLWLLLRLPGAGSVGPKIYQAIADRRRRACDGACAIHRGGGTNSIS